MPRIDNYSENNVKSDRMQISIVTPNYNMARYLRKTVESVLCQQDVSLEYIFVDDGSTDGSVELARSYDQRIKVLTKQNSGQYDSITKAFAVTTGEVMGWINSDDFYCPWALKTVCDVFTQFPEIDWLTSLTHMQANVQGNVIGFWTLPGISRQAFLDGAYLLETDEPAIRIGVHYGTLQQESTFWRRSLWTKCGSNVSSDYGAAGDFELWCRFSRHAECYGIPVPLGIFRIREGQSSGKTREYAAHSERALLDLRNDMGWRPDWRNHCVRNRWGRKISRLLGNAYVAKNLACRNPGSESASWEIRDHKFL